MPTKDPTITLHHHFIKNKTKHHNFLLITPTKWKNIISEYRAVGLVLRNDMLLLIFRLGWMRTSISSSGLGRAFVNQ